MLKLLMNKAKSRMQLSVFWEKELNLGKDTKNIGSWVGYPKKWDFQLSALMLSSLSAKRILFQYTMTSIEN